ncbi:hypothetical protein ACFP51_32735 [Streptomyces pratens]|uniref:Uncharacterized protein n=1 Tax=Streptomyces pratens TaxID=887456 RepID=A0ABW1MAS1_9ACTN
MGNKPVVTASPAPTASASPVHSASACGRFGMSHAFVITAFVVTAAFLAPDAKDVQEVLWLLAGSGGIGAAVVALVVTAGRGGGRFSRLVRAYFGAGI